MEASTWSALFSFSITSSRYYESGDGDVFVDCGPLDPDTSPDQSVVSQFLGTRVSQTRDQIQGHYNLPSIRKTQVERILRAPYLYSARL
jgi:hypothetical protein